MKKLLIIFCFLISMFLGIQTSWASNIILVDGEGDDDETVDVTVDDYDFNGYYLFYRLNSGDYQMWETDDTIDGDGGDTLTFALSTSTSSTNIFTDLDDAELRWIDDIPAKYSDKPELTNNYYRSIIISWEDEYHLTVLGTEEPYDGFTVPIPASVMLLGSGLCGILLLRRRMRERRL